MHKSAIRIALLLPLFWGQTLLAQDLATIYGLALENDAELMIAEADYLAAIEAVPLARSERRPQVFFDASGSLSESDNSETGSNSNETIGYSVSLTQSLYDTESKANLN